MTRPTPARRQIRQACAWAATSAMTWWLLWTPPWTGPWSSSAPWRGPGLRALPVRLCHAGCRASCCLEGVEGVPERRQSQGACLHTPFAWCAARCCGITVVPSARERTACPTTCESMFTPCHGYSLASLPALTSSVQAGSSSMGVWWCVLCTRHVQPSKSCRRRVEGASSILPTTCHCILACQARCLGSLFSCGSAPVGCSVTPLMVWAVFPQLPVDFEWAACAGSLAVEVCCGALQHPKGVYAPAAQHDVAASSATGHQDAVLPLGPVPHMIRCMQAHRHGDLRSNGLGKKGPRLWVQPVNDLQGVLMGYQSPC